MKTASTCAWKKLLKEEHTLSLSMLKNATTAESALTSVRLAQFMKTRFNYEKIYHH